MSRSAAPWSTLPVPPFFIFRTMPLISRGLGCGEKELHCRVYVCSYTLTVTPPASQLELCLSSSGCVGSSDWALAHRLFHAGAVQRACQGSVYHRLRQARTSTVYHPRDNTHRCTCSLPKVTSASRHAHERCMPT